MKSVRPQVLLLSLAALGLSGLLLWLAWPSPVSEEARPAAPERATADSHFLEAQGARAEDQPAESAETLGKISQPKEQKPEPKKARAVPGKKYREKLRREKLAKRQRALGRLRDLKYSESEAERIRNLWEAAFEEADKKITETKLEKGNISGNEKRFAYQNAYNGLREQLGEDDYASARYSADMSTSVWIRDVTQNSPAELAGLLPGDRILSYNGERLFQIEDFRSLKFQAPADSIATLGIVRGGEVFYVEIPQGYLGTPVVGKVLQP